MAPQVYGAGPSCLHSGRSAAAVKPVTGDRAPRKVATSCGASGTILLLAGDGPGPSGLPWTPPPNLPTAGVLRSGGVTGWPPVRLV